MVEWSKNIIIEIANGRFELRSDKLPDQQPKEPT
jgi:hypothetical protein